MEREKDPMIKFRSVIRGKNSKGGDRFQLYLGGHQEFGNEQLQALIDVLTAQLDNPKGAKLDLHVSKKEYEGRTFDTAIAFVKPVSDTGGFGGAPKRSFAPVGTSNEAPAASASTRAKAAKLARPNKELA